MLAFYLEVFSLLAAEQLIDVIDRVMMMLMYDHAVSSFTISTVLPIMRSSSESARKRPFPSANFPTFVPSLYW